MSPSSAARRLLIVASKLGYQTRGFAEAAQRLGVEAIFGTDRCHQLDDPWRDAAVALQFETPEAAARLLVESLHGRAVGGVLAIGDRPAVAAAFASRALGLRFHSPEAVLNCRSKLRQRRLFRDAGLPTPEFFSFSTTGNLSRLTQRLRFPCVVKPLVLSASQGVIRANNPEEFVLAVWRVKALLESPEIQSKREPELDRLLAEGYIPGAEYAVEGLMTGGRLRVLALFDKPDPLEGPYFEETIYVTPSRLPPEAQRRAIAAVETAIRALGLSDGPVHAEFRWNEDAAWILEVNPRPIGGLCSRALRFGPEKIFLEELLVLHALDLPGAELEREPRAAGVMMIPVPQSGILEAVEGVDAARATPGVEELHITARLHDFIAAWPEGASYLGFVIARGEAPGAVEGALRQAHKELRFRFRQRLPVEHPATGRLSAPPSEPAT